MAIAPERFTTNAEPAAVSIQPSACSGSTKPPFAASAILLVEPPKITVPAAPDVKYTLTAAAAMMHNPSTRIFLFATAATSVLSPDDAAPIAAYFTAAVPKIFEN